MRSSQLLMNAKWGNTASIRARRGTFTYSLYHKQKSPSTWTKYCHMTGLFKNKFKHKTSMRCQPSLQSNFGLFAFAASTLRGRKLAYNHLMVRNKSILLSCEIFTHTNTFRTVESLTIASYMRSWWLTSPRAIGMARLQYITVIKRDSERPLTTGWWAEPNMSFLRGAVCRRRNYKLDLNKQTAAVWPPLQELFGGCCWRCLLALLQHYSTITEECTQTCSI